MFTNKRVNIISPLEPNGVLSTRQFPISPEQFRLGPNIRQNFQVRYKFSRTLRALFAGFKSSFIILFPKWNLSEFNPKFYFNDIVGTIRRGQTIRLVFLLFLQWYFLILFSVTIHFQIIMSLLGSFVIYSFGEKSSKPFRKEVLNFFLLDDNLVHVSFLFVIRK